MRSCTSDKPLLLAMILGAGGRKLCSRQSLPNNHRARSFCDSSNNPTVLWLQKNRRRTVPNSCIVITYFGPKWISLHLGVGTLREKSMPKRLTVPA